MSPRAVRPGIYHATFTCVRRLYLLWPGKRLNKVLANPVKDHLVE